MSVYHFWKGAGFVTRSSLFIIQQDGTPKDVTNDAAYGAIKDYLPGGSEDQNGLPVYLVGRVPMKSKSGDPNKDVVKLFANSTWEPKLLEAFELMEFTMTADDDPKRLESDFDVDLTAGIWTAKGKMELFWDLPGPGKPTAKVAFTNGNQSVSAFWCWPE